MEPSDVPSTTTVTELPLVPAKNGTVMHEYWLGRIAYTSLIGMLAIVLYCLLWTPAFWDAVVSVLPVLTSIISTYTGAQYGLMQAKKG